MLIEQGSKGKKNTPMTSSSAPNAPPNNASSDSETTSKTRSAVPTDVNVSLGSSAPAKSFASLRSTRESKKTFISSSPVQQTAIHSDLRKPIDNTADTGPRASSLSRVPSPPVNPASTSPGAGLMLLRKLASCHADHLAAYRLLTCYPPTVLAKILDGILEPDVLGQILLAVEAGVEEDRDEEKAENILINLKATSRWRINVAMLDLKEKLAGQKAWAACGARGSWP